MKNISSKSGWWLTSFTLFSLISVSLLNADNVDGAAPRGYQSAFMQTVHTLESRRGSDNSVRKSNSQAAFEDGEKTRPLQEFGLHRDTIPGRAESIHYPSRLNQFGNSEARFLDKNKQLGTLMFEGINEQSEYEALLSFLETIKYRADGTEDLNHLSLKNDALACLIGHQPVPLGLGEYMISIVQDESAGMIWREYVLQYFCNYYRARWPLPNETVDDLDRRAMQRAIAAALFHEDSGLAGTALIVLEDLAPDYPEFDSRVIRRSIRRLAMSEDSCLATRVTALSMCEDFSDDAEIAQVAQIASDTKQDTVIRLVAAGRLMKWSHDSNVARDCVDEMSANAEPGPVAEKFREWRTNQNQSR